MGRSFLNTQVVSESRNQRMYHLCDFVRQRIWGESFTVRKAHGMFIDLSLLRMYEYAIITRDFITKGKSR